jgi:large subunit ribosomal protein L15
MPHKLKKSRKQRGSRYCGWGQVGQHRKGGMRGGKGRAGGRKHFWIRTVKYEPNRYKKIGFKPPSSLEKKDKSINVGELYELILGNFGLNSTSTEAEFSLDLNFLGYDKLLGKGKVDQPLLVKVSECSVKAQEKIEAAGGQITIVK